MPGIPLEEIVAGVNSTGLVWLWLLRLRALNPRDKYHTLSSEGLERYGVDRFAKYRALITIVLRSTSSPDRGAA
jgi:hypothetical protein